MAIYQSKKMAPSAIISSSMVTAIIYLLATPCCSGDEIVNPAPTKYKLLYYPIDRAGSHYMHLSKSASALVRQGHHVTFLFSSSQPTWRQKTDADLFSSVVFNSRYTYAEFYEALQHEFVRPLIIEGRHGPFFIVSLLIDAVSGNRAVDILIKQCDDLLGDMGTIESLRTERFDMLVGDCALLCQPLLAQTLDIPFVQSSNLPILPVWHGQ